MNRHILNLGLLGLFSLCVCFLGCEPLVEKDIPLYDEVKGFVIDASDNKIIATNTGLFSFRNGIYTPLTITDVNATILNDMIRSGQDTWLATNAGLINQSASTSISSSNSCLPNDFITKMAIDYRGVVYAGSSDGITVIDQSQCFDTIGRDKEMIKFEITDIGTATNDYTYVTTYGGGVGRFKYDVDGITGATVFDKDWSELRTNYVHTVFIEDTIQWFGSVNGVAKHNSIYTKWDWETWHVEDGLISDTVISVAKDLENNMWFGTCRGISRFDEEAGTWTNYDVDSHNIINDTVCKIAVESNGKVWIATASGLSAFDGSTWTNYSNIEEQIEE